MDGFVPQCWCEVSVDFDRSNVVVQPPRSCSAVVAEKRFTGQLVWLS